MTPTRGEGAGDREVEFVLEETDGPEVELSLNTPGGELLGRWMFRGAGPGRASVAIDWLAAPTDAVTMTSAGRRLAPECLEWRAGTVVRPDMEVRVSSAGPTRVMPVRVTDARALERYYSQESHQDEYVVQHPFFLAFHAARLRTLGRLFRKNIRPGSRVLDVGSGYSMFFLITTDWPFEVTCCDLDAAAMEKMRGLVPGWDWVVADAAALPWDDASFDTVYAGEIIEHVGDPAAALAEWRRVLKAGGTLIITTPNGARLLARANRARAPVHPEHVREFDLGELTELLGASGFEVRKVTGIYLELGLNWYRPPGRRVDMLVSLTSDPRLEPLYRPFMFLGRIAPSLAYDLVAVCTRR